MKKSFKNEKGITLVSLVITIIILLMLSSVALFTVTDDGGILDSIENQKVEMQEAEARQIVEVNIEKLKLKGLDAEQFIEELKQELSKEDANVEVTFNETDNVYNVIFNEYNFSYYYSKDQTRTITGRMPSYYNPIIPIGFDILETEDASWEVVEDENLGKVVKGWNDGLVIQDKYGNEFVWVPVHNEDIGDIKAVPYQKWYGEKNHADITKEGGLEAVKKEKDELPNGISDENTQITKYGGFYIGRYEAGIPSTSTEALNDSNKRNIPGESGNAIKPVSQKNQIPWNWINYNNAKKNAEAMYTSDYVQSGLLTGTMWDTTMKWLESKVNVSSDSTDWGNYRTSNVTGITEYTKKSGFTDKTESWQKATGITKTGNATESNEYMWLVKTGNTDYTKRKNIYDLAGNLWEWTNEIYSSYRIIRGGGYYNISSDYPACYRYHYALTNTTSHVGFRVALYLK